MTRSQTGSVETQTSSSEQDLKAQQSSSSDAPTTPQDNSTRPRTEADRLKDVNALLTGAMTPDDVQTDDSDDNDDASDDGADGPIDGSGARSPADDGEGDDDAAGGADAALSSPPKTLRDIADTLGVKIADVYDIEVPLKDGETVKLGAMKDAYRDKQTADAEHAHRAAQMDERETAIATEQRLWAQIGQELTEKLTPETRHALTQRLGAQQQHERGELMRAMPELRDTAKFDAFRDEVVQTLSRYGYQPHEIVVGDHRQLLVVRDLARAQARLKQLRDYKPTPKTPNSAKSNGRQHAGRNKAQLMQRARKGGQTDKVNAVSALINGG